MFGTAFPSLASSARIQTGRRGATPPPTAAATAAATVAPATLASRECNTELARRGRQGQPPPGCIERASLGEQVKCCVGDRNCHFVGDGRVRGGFPFGLMRDERYVYHKLEDYGYYAEAAELRDLWNKYYMRPECWKCNNDCRDHVDAIEYAKDCTATPRPRWCAQQQGLQGAAWAALGRWLITRLKALVYYNVDVPELNIAQSYNMPSADGNFYNISELRSNTTPRQQDARVRQALGVPPAGIAGSLNAVLQNLAPGEQAALGGLRALLQPPPPRSRRRTHRSTAAHGRRAYRTRKRKRKTTRRRQKSKRHNNNSTKRYHRKRKT